MATINQIIKVSRLEEAYSLNQQRSHIVLGGFMWLNLGKRSIQTAIDLSGLGLDQIDETEGRFSIGCMCTLRNLELHSGLNREFQDGIRQAVQHIVGVQFRNGATVGGSIYGRYGFSDLLTCLLVLYADVELYPTGVIPLKEFAQQDRSNDLLVRLLVKKDQRILSYQSQRNSHTDFPVINLAAARKEHHFYFAVGARPAKAALIEIPNCSLNKNSTAAEIATLSDWAADQFKYGNNMRGRSAYRHHLAAVYLNRAIKTLL